VISINGSGAAPHRAPTGTGQYALARDQLSAVESLMFTLKQGFDFGEVAPGLGRSWRLLEALANLCHLARVRQGREAAAKNDDERTPPRPGVSEPLLGSAPKTGDRMALLCARQPNARFRPRGSPCNRDDALVAARSSLPDPQRGSSRSP
jgi:hypothetical protein